LHPHKCFRAGFVSQTYLAGFHFAGTKRALEMSLEDRLRVARQMDRKNDFGRVKPDAVNPKHLGAQDIRLQNDTVLIEPDHPNRRQVEVAEISRLQLLRLHAALPQFFVLDFQLCAVNAKLFEGMS
jgi:hypothetical protein